MKSALRRLFRPAPARRKPADSRRARPVVERLEAREVPTVTKQPGGMMLAMPEVQALYLGADWGANPYYSQTGSVENFLKSLNSGSYLDMLTGAGYGVQRNFSDPFDRGWIDTTYLGSLITDLQIQRALLANLNNHHLKPSDGNRLYVVFVEDNVVVQNASGQTSQPGGAFLGYHSYISPLMTGVLSGTFYSAGVPYAVVAYPGGSNATVSWLNAFDQMTMVASHEFAEGVTDPDTVSGYRDYGAFGKPEIGDICANSTVFLNGNAVQRIADKNDQPMTPPGAVARDQVSFVLRQDGSLYQYNGYQSNGSAPTRLTGSFVSVSAQGIDPQGHAMVDVIDTGGNAWEYHVGQGWVNLGGNIQSAVAGQAVSYALFNDGTVKEYPDPMYTWQRTPWVWRDNYYLRTIDAGTDRYGVNMFVELDTSGRVWELSDSTGLHYVGSSCASASAGQQGIIGLLDTSGNAYYYQEATGSTKWLASGATTVAAGTNSSGGWEIDVVFSYLINNVAFFYEDGNSYPAPHYYWTAISIGKPRHGYINTVSNWGGAWLLNYNFSAMPLGGSALAAV